MDNKLETLNKYLAMGWPLFPCGADKKPLTEHGFKDATLDPETVERWHRNNPYANWAIPTGPKGEGAGIVVVDIDNHKDKPNGFETWEILRGDHPEPIETVTARTGGGGQQMFFRYPNGHIVKSRNDCLGPSIDIKATGGYVLIPPSKTDKPYVFELSPDDVEIAPLPEWILTRVNGQREEIKAPEVKAPPSKLDDKPDLAIALSALNALRASRADNYDEWLAVGMSLRGLDDAGLSAWDNWSQKSDKYERGMCAQKWATITQELTDANKITFGSLIHWAKEDGVQPFIRYAPKKAKPSDYVKALQAFGSEFSLNDMNDTIYHNGIRMNDVMTNGIEYNLREYRYKSEKDTTVAIAKLAQDNRFHPIKDYLNSLEWEGWTDDEGQFVGVDHIGHLAGYFTDKDGIFPELLRKWLVGAVGRILGAHPGQHHPMLVFDGPQGLGKSRFAWWLGSPLPEYYLQSPINTNDKDFLILLCSKFVWEVEELGATFRKSDLESLKGFLSKEVVNVRKPYGRDEIVKPATASFIGTINNSSGFLADPTGSRRFRVCSLTSIDWAYEQNVDINQVWAQAVALYKEGERWTFDREFNERITEINTRYEVDDPLEFQVTAAFHVDPAQVDQFVTVAQIIERLQSDGKVSASANPQALATRIGAVLAGMGCERVRRRIEGHTNPQRLWLGVWPKDQYAKNS